MVVINQEDTLFVSLVFYPTGEFFTHIETSPLPLKGCKMLTYIGTHHYMARNIADTA